MLRGRDPAVPTEVVEEPQPQPQEADLLPPTPQECVDADHARNSPRGGEQHDAKRKGDSLVHALCPFRQRRRDYNATPSAGIGSGSMYRGCSSSACSVAHSPSWMISAARV